ncbi:MAG: NYN domain-containing protein [Aquincola sp.]|nr:NYN domain-containing protein [Aquincola sp.]MDH4289709.1 NYN domain-containing protein [Aquincola sp.]MDH5330822.1 NYN domain-containing protein [Aquincola sp.]
MNRDRVMLLIDADNVSIDVIEQAVAWVHKHYGGPHVRRAYCTAESAVRHQAQFKRLSIRPMVNLAAGKNSTDIALAVDAVDLATTERPDVVVIASSDSDFAPLVARLREKGCRVVGVGQDGKTGDETIAAYDDYEVLSHSARRTVGTAAEGTPAKAVPAKAAATQGRVAGRKAVTRKTTRAAPPPAPELPDKVRAILQALPALAAGDKVELRVAAERLREAGLLSRSGSSTKLFAPHAEWFELLPPKAPNHVRWRAP